MTTARKPQDRKPKTPTRKTFEITVRGVALSIPVEKFDDFELMFDMQTIDHCDETEALPRLVDVFARMLGLGDARRLIAGARADGPLTIEAGVGLINEVFEALKVAEAPNS